MARLLGHRQTKGTETDKPNLRLPRHISTLLVQDAHGEFQILLLDDHRDLDFRGRDHLQVDVLLRQCSEHLARDPRVGAHPDADSRNLAGRVVSGEISSADFLLDAFENAERFAVVVAIDREGKIGRPVAANILDDHVDVNVRFGDRPQDLVSNTGAVRERPGR
jgi:hypothetical protein